MPFDALTTLETTAKKPWRQALARKIKDNFDDHETRILGLEGVTSVRIFDHFLGRAPSIAGAVVLDPKLWNIAVHSTNTAALIADKHLVRLLCSDTGTAAQNDAVIRSAMRVYGHMLPYFKCRSRVQLYANVQDAYWGFTNDFAISVGTNPSDGVYLWKEKDQNLRFVAVKDGTSTIGTGFTQPADDAWFEVEIKWTDADSVECRFDGSLKSTFNGPSGSGDKVPDGTADALHAGVYYQYPDTFASSKYIDTCWIDFRATVLVNET